MDYKYVIFIICFSVATRLGLAQLPFTANFFCLDSSLRYGNSLKNSHKGVIVRDFNKDGYPDLASVINKTPNGKEIIFLTNNSLTSTVTLFNEYFYPISSTPTGTNTNVNSITAGFINTDSLADVLFIDNNNLNVFVNSTATTGFNVPITGSVVNGYNFLTNYGGYAKFIKGMDFNADRKTDVVVFTQSSSGQLVVMMLRNNSTLTSINFILDATYTVYPGTDLLNVVQDCDLSVNDVNNDNNPDVLLMYRSHAPYNGYGFINTSTNSGVLSFVGFTLAPQGTYPITVQYVNYKSVAVAKVNEFDNINDIVFGINIPLSSSIISYLENSTGSSVNPTQTFALPVNGDFIKDLTLTDLTGDKNKDLVVLTSNLTASNRLLIYYYDPSINGFNSNFTSIAMPASVDSLINELVVMDYNNDTRWDLILKSWSKVTNLNPEYIYLIPNFGNKSFLNPTNYAVCSNTSIVLTPTIAYTGNHNYAWSLNTATSNPVGTSLTHTLLPPSATGVNNYSFNFSYKLPYSGLTCNYKPLSINVASLAVPSVSFSTSSSIVCKGDKAILSTTTNFASTYTIFPLNISNTSTIMVTPTNLVNYTAIATASNGCFAASSLQINVHPTQTAEIAPLTSYNICLNDSVHLKSNKVANSYLWFNGNTNSNFYFKPTAQGNYLISLGTMDTNNCKTDEAIIQITVNDCINSDTLIKTYNLITPNGDGLNDILFIENISNYPDTEVTIFSRWGRQLFNKKNYNNANISWPAPNENIPSGTYYYTVTNNKLILLKGWIEILKN
jgi:gliding motility-associated-like protein